MKRYLSVPLLLSVGLAFVFAYAGVSSLMHPLEWIAYVPHMVSTALSPVTAIKLIAVYELLLAVWLLSGKYRKYAALLSSLTLVGIVVANLGQMIITFRDVGLIFMALALFVSA